MDACLAAGRAAVTSAGGLGRLRHPGRDRRARGRWPLLVAGFALYLVVLGVVSWRTGLLGAEVRPWQLGPLATAIRIIGIVVLTPFVEEVILRGVLQWKLAERLPVAAAILIQAAVFTAFHAPSLAEPRTLACDVAQLLLEGSFYGWTRHRTRSLYPSMAIHGLGNAVAVLERRLL